MFGKTMSIPDSLMENYFTLLTDMPAERIRELTNPAKTHPKEAKVLLGKLIVEQFYGRSAAEQAAEEFEKVFAQSQLPDQLSEAAVSAAPIAAAKLLVECGLAETGGQAKRAVLQGGVRINNEKITDPNQQIIPQNGMVVQVGKRKFVRLKV
jgi:tyrosyl-tRNA synthetase